MWQEVKNVSKCHTRFRRPSQGKGRRRPYPMYLAIWRGRLRILQYIIPHATRSLPANPFRRTPPPLIVRQRKRERERERQGLIYERRRERERDRSFVRPYADRQKREVPTSFRDRMSQQSNSQCSRVAADAKVTQRWETNFGPLDQKKPASAIHVAGSRHTLDLGLRQVRPRGLTILRIYLLYYECKLRVGSRDRRI